MSTSTYAERYAAELAAAPRYSIDLDGVALEVAVGEVTTAVPWTAFDPGEDASAEVLAVFAGGDTDIAELLTDAQMRRIELATLEAIEADQIERRASVDQVLRENGFPLLRAA